MGGSSFLWRPSTNYEHLIWYKNRRLWLYFWKCLQRQNVLPNFWYSNMSYHAVCIHKQAHSRIHGYEWVHSLGWHTFFLMHNFRLCCYQFLIHWGQTRLSMTIYQTTSDKTWDNITVSLSVTYGVSVVLGNCSCRNNGLSKNALCHVVLNKLQPF
jgi:hypothetical protein